MLRRGPLKLHHRFFRRRHITLGIRREDPKRIWERRTPLTPSGISSLLSSSRDLEVEVESCQRRCYPDNAYLSVGAKIVDQLDKADVVLGIKEPPADQVRRLGDRNRKWMIFSHTHKGQEHNMSLLNAMMETKQTLIDHELLTTISPDGEKQERVAAFGWYAGAVGAGEALSLTGLALLQRGQATSLLHLPRPYTFQSLQEYKLALRRTGDACKIPVSGGSKPIVIGVTGKGKVAQGAMEMLDAMGVQWIPVGQLSDVDSNGISAYHITPSDYLVREDGRHYDRADYYARPNFYRSIFSAKITPYLTTLINGVGWNDGFPPVMSTSDLNTLVDAEAGKQKLVVVQDVTCDLHGGLEFVDKHTTIDQPHFIGPGGVLISTTDILPAEMPIEASDHFSRCLLPYVGRALGLCDASTNQRHLDDTLKRASIVDHGQLIEPHRHLESKLEKWRIATGTSIVSSSSVAPSSTKTTKIRPKKKVLLLGSGLVAGPAVDVFVQRGDIELAIGSNNLAEAHALAGGRSNVTALHIDVSDQSALSNAILTADVIVSLLPAPKHPSVARLCIAHGKHMVTASYISPEMKSLHHDAVNKGVVLLNECGLDPGIDSMAAMRILGRAKREGKRVTSFVSWCGGLPSPECADVPLGYKFAWSSKAVLTASLNPATYKLHNSIHHIPAGGIISHPFTSLDLWRGLNLEGVANRDSLPYAAKYGMGSVENMDDIFRGTLRYEGFCKVMDGFRKIGLLSLTPLYREPKDWEDFLMVCAEQTRRDVGMNEGSWEGMLGKEGEDVVIALEWLGLLGSKSTLNSDLPLPQTKTPIDITAHLLGHRLRYLPKERDMVLLHHTFHLHNSSDVSYEAERHPERGMKVTASLVHYGDETSSAMSMTVGKTLAFATGRILDGHVSSRGVIGPDDPDVWTGVLDQLEEVGVIVQESWFV
ncbi:hypothetical protein TREMEDRAFT_29255 [Tremella mesenterica DSM 1558]|uniref:uncharacterized protein n=1 Tax=Tremella mesenterica (strain ATCC 24925 / CBS 8224 / DSM 1558 / NBRC 9311 / NRRL Y-6157 / RJB 2259-6 / UBC 559-6) TaxID=578456 RepID=UPI0003F48C7C|nr:uncharacterized protein TREMEDRAFT_29255 [Tremella mesenterica DSM 1558]EIW70700.1 hypothetical protein TREMEDRAFT_29255 [Tremella mesenterica DSM 1558]